VRGFGQPGLDWTVILRRQPVRIVEGQPEGGLHRFVRDHLLRCDDHPDLYYREVSPELQRIRGPYPVAAWAVAHEEHLALHHNRKAIRQLGRARHDVNGRLPLVLGLR